MNADATTDTELLDDEPVFPENENGKRRKLDFLGHAACPFRTLLRQRLHRLLSDPRRFGGAAPAWFMPAGCHAAHVYEELWKTEDADALPCLLADTGFGDYNRPEFKQRWLDSGFYAPIPDAAVRREFREAGLLDRLGRHQVYGASPELILVDLARLGARPVPRTWSDLLHPRFARDIVISGEPGDIHESFLFGLYQDHGTQALEFLGANVKDFMHPAEMAKCAGSLNPRGAALYIVPGFFARGCPHGHRVRVVWPEDGAYVSPFYMLRRSDPTPAAEAVRSFLTSAEWALQLSQLGLIPAREDSAPLPGPLRWVGWDFVRGNDLEALRGPLNAAFVLGHGST